MKLYLVPTPIGNLADMTYRAVEILNSVDLILAEDTRTSGKLLNHYGIKTPMLSYHMHNEHKISDHIVTRIQGGETMALITDAGTPGISDPGFLLSRKLIAADVAVESLPGATAFVPALVCSGLPSDKFVFEGFLTRQKRPPNQTQRTRRRNQNHHLLRVAPQTPKNPRPISKPITALIDRFLFPEKSPKCLKNIIEVLLQRQYSILQRISREVSLYWY